MIINLSKVSNKEAKAISNAIKFLEKYNIGVIITNSELNEINNKAKEFDLILSPTEEIKDIDFDGTEIHEAYEK